MLLNDPTYVEAARVFAERILRDGGRSVRGAAALRLPHAPCSAPPSAAPKLRSCSRSCCERTQDEFAARSKRRPGACWRPASTECRGDLPPAELAAWTSVARAILNLHETITRY